MPIDVTCSECNTRFQVKDEFAGRKVRCSQCKSVIELPAAQESDSLFPEDLSLDPVFRRDKFLLHQKHFSINTRYSIFDESGQPIMYVVRPTHFFRSLLAMFGVMFVMIAAIIGVVVLIMAVSQPLGEVGAAVVGVIAGISAVALTIFTYLLLAPKRHITFFADEKYEQKLLEILQDQKIAIRMATYTVRDEKGEEIGRFRKDYLANILRKRWDGFNSQGDHLCVIREDSILLSLLRRLLGNFYGLLRTNFVIHQADEGQAGQLLGEFNRKFTLLDRYVLDCTHDRSRTLDRRMAIAIGVLLDTAEKR